MRTARPTELRFARDRGCGGGDAITAQDAHAQSNYTSSLVATVHAGGLLQSTSVLAVCAEGEGMGVMRNAIKGLTLSLWSRAVSAGMSDVTSPPVRCN